MWEWLIYLRNVLGCIISWLFSLPSVRWGTKEHRVNSHPLGLGKKKHRNERSLSAPSYIPKHSYTVSLSDVLSHPMLKAYIHTHIDNESGKKGKQSPSCLLFLVPRAEARKTKFHYTHIDTMTAIIFSLRSEKIDVSWCIPFSPRAKALSLERDADLLSHPPCSRKTSGRLKLK